MTLTAASNMPAREESAECAEHMKYIRKKTPMLSADNPTYVDGPVPRLTLSALIMGAFISFGGFMYGYAVGQTAGYLEMPVFLNTFGSKNAAGEAYFTNVRSGLIVGLLSIGSMVGCLCAGLLANRFGLKWSVTSWCVVHQLGVIIQISAQSPDWYQVIVGRFFMGLGVGALSVVGPMYQSEMSPRQIRGAVMVSYAVSITLGVLVADCIAYGTHQMTTSAAWRIPLGISFLPALILGLGIIFFPETPRFTYRHGRIEQARAAMSKMYGVSPNHRVVAEELEEIKVKVDEEMKRSKQSLYQILTTRRTGYRIFLGMATGSLQQLCGSNFFFFYGTVVFNGIGNINAYVASIALGAVNFGATFIGLYVVERFGRRKSLLCGSAWMFTCFMIFASVGHFALDLQNPGTTKSAGRTLIAFACLYLVGFASTWAPIPVVVYSELFPSEYRAIGIAVSSGSYWFWNFLVAFFTPSITDAIDFCYGYVFAGCIALGFAFVYFLVVEGRGLTLEEIDTAYILHISPRKSPRWAPSPEELGMHLANIENVHSGSTKRSELPGKGAERV